MKTVFLDMDGVVADFDEYAGRILGRSQVLPTGWKYPHSDWVKLRDCERFYRDMKVIPGAHEFVHRVVALCGELWWQVRFLTAVPSGNDMPWAFTDKVDWAREHFPGIPVWFGPYSSDKHLRAHGDAVLIDDRISNIKDWTDAGGIGLLFTGNFGETLQELNRIMRV